MEQSDTFRHIVVIGMGALGIMYADLLAQGLPDGSVTVVADADRIARYRACEVTANASKCTFGYATPEDYGPKADLVVFGVKATALDAAIELAKAVSNPDTVMLSLLNGISSEELIGQDLKSSPVIYCVAQGMDALRKGTAVTYMNKGVLCVGLPEETKTDARCADALRKLEATFDLCRIPYVHEEDIIRRQWCKWMFNIGVNQTLMVHEGTFADVQKPGSVRDQYIAAMREVVALAQKVGVDVSEKDLQEYIAIGQTLNPQGMPSMRQDGLAKRRSEVELFSGTLIRKAEKFGVDVPVNRALYARVKEIESKY